VSLRAIRDDGGGESRMVDSLTHEGIVSSKAYR
jgi:hypothetical protein